MSRNKLFAVLLSCMASAQSLNGSTVNLMMNGSFEANSSTGKLVNLPNATFNSKFGDGSVVAYGNDDSRGIDLWQDAVGQNYGLAPFDGDWKVSIGTMPNVNPLEAFALKLSSPLVVGSEYTLIFYLENLQDGIRGGGGTVEIGLSNSSSSFGGLLTSATTDDNILSPTWKQHTYIFTASSSATWLTVQPFNVPSGPPFPWIGLDNFSLTTPQTSPIPEPGSNLALLALGAGGLTLRRRLKRAA
jgi:hypothetical protein